MTASRLYRSTPGLPRPLFTVAVAGKTFTDGQIHALTIRHGKQNPAGGLHPATAEIEVTGAVGILNNRDITVRLHDDAAVSLAGTVNGVGTRFTGRVGKQRVIERARRRPGPPRRSTTLMCSSWSSVYLASGRGVIYGSAGSLATELRRVLDNAESWVGKYLPTSFIGNWADYVSIGDYTASLSEVIDKYYAETGRLLRQRRNGTVDGLALQYRADAGEAAAASWWPITLGHAVSEVAHEQNTDAGNVGIQLRWREAPPEDYLSYTERSVLWSWPGSADGVPATEVAEWDEYDWTHTTFTTEQYRHAINAIASRATRTAYTTPAITVDLLALIRSSSEYDRVMLRQLLKLEQGDPVILGGDWSSWWNGIYYAEEITERITPDEWTLELALYPPQEVTGHYGQGGAPEIPARIWSQAVSPWSADQSRIWSDY